MSAPPSQGFFTSKIAKNPYFFESEKHPNNQNQTNWVLSDI